jgi:uncharacterized protein with GYD domain
MEAAMSKYLLQVSYTADGVKGVLKDGGSKRRQAAQTLAESLGGKLESLYFAFGETDVFAVVDMPDNASVAAMALAVSGSGGATAKTTALLTTDEIDQAVKKSGRYTPPGH